MKIEDDEDSPLVQEESIKKRSSSLREFIEHQQIGYSQENIETVLGHKANVATVGPSRIEYKSTEKAFGAIQPQGEAILSDDGFQ